MKSSLSMFTEKTRSVELEPDQPTKSPTPWALKEKSPRLSVLRGIYSSALLDDSHSETSPVVSDAFSSRRLRTAAVTKYLWVVYRLLPDYLS
ncbi:hypothetical protein [Rhizobium etli]|uniref:hypothetical protein n=1 Tax=Rhizobium etli TaxID=29449 RepID=UPI001FD8EE76|nr:hypothetical protein [Rhizobium sp. IE4771]